MRNCFSHVDAEVMCMLNEVWIRRGGVGHLLEDIGYTHLVGENAIAQAKKIISIALDKSYPRLDDSDSNSGHTIRAEIEELIESILK